MDNEFKGIDIDKIVRSDNICKLLPDGFIGSIGIEAKRGYLEDLDSRSEWEMRNADSFKLALQVREEKTYPFVGASNVKFPLITVAAMQFHARAYPATVPSTGLVKAAVYGPDFDGENSKRATRISTHMTWQLMEEAPEWEVNHDKGLLTLSICGDMFKKTYFDPVEGRNKHDLVLPKDLVINYWAKTVDDAPRITHRITMSPNQIRENIVREIYSDIGDIKLGQTSNGNGTQELEAAKDEAQGMRKPVDGDTTPITVLEQLCWIDLDKDGYAEPYIVSIREADSKVYRIISRFIDQGDVIRLNDKRVKALKNELDELTNDSPIEERKKLYSEMTRLKDDKKNHIIRIIPIKHYTHYQFIPSPDGGFYGIGLGSLLGPINESIDTSINQLIDAGTNNNLGGGFLGPGVSIKAGTQERDPGSWIPLNGRGDDIRKGMMPYPQVQQSPILLEMLKLLIDYGERVAGTTDSQVGVAPGQNTPAETSRNTLEQGMKVFTAIYKRIWRSIKQELNVVYQLNRIYLEGEQHYHNLIDGQSAMIKRDDYIHELVNVIPAADPNVASESQKIKQAADVLMFCKSTPGTNVYEAGKRYLEASKVPGIDVVYPDPKGPNAIKPQPSPQVQIEQMKSQTKQMDSQIKLKTMQLKLMAEAEVNQAKVQNLQAQAIKALAEAKGVESGHAIALLEAQIGAAKAHQEGILRTIDMVHDAMIDKEERNDKQTGVEGMAESPRDAAVA